MLSMLSFLQSRKEKGVYVLAACVPTRRGRGGMSKHVSLLAHVEENVSHGRVPA